MKSKTTGVKGDFSFYHIITEKSNREFSAEVLFQNNDRNFSVFHFLASNVRKYASCDSERIMYFK